MLKISLVTVLTACAIAGTARATTTIEWWQFWTDPGVKPTIEAIVDDFEKANPDFEVKLTDLTWANGHEKIVVALASGAGPDVLELGSDWLAQFASSGHLKDLSEHLAGDTADYHGYSMADYNGKLYAKPWILGTRVLFANRSLLIRAEYDSGFAPVTMDQLKQAALKVDSLGSDIYGWGSNTAEKHRLYKKFLPFFWSYGAQIFTDDNRYCVLTSTKAVDALSIYKELHDSCGFVSNQRGIEDAFLDGKVGFIISGDWLLKRIEREQRDIDLVSTLMPGLKYPGRSFLGGEYLVVNASSENSEGAVKLIDFITTAANQVRFCKANRSANPSSNIAQEDPYFKSNMHLQTFIKQMSMVKHPPVDPDWVYIESAIEEAVEDALFGSGHPAEALLKARQKIEALKKK
ncbi:MAG: extracellular solute-binding protein [candidate division Zixibacteria bacterium]|nr:extracellular solute-binding protein [candidate division Zixibacteria bacterium]MDH3938342.1 extracellular solute-binding protein [candidate division Zixibacteria bacterium]MDH4034529.1 extracellular solute-binding protein [candidate division Zixibacteria bacterium]